MTFSYFSLLKNLNNNSVLVNSKLNLLKKLRGVNKKVFLKKVYLRNNLVKKHNNFKFKYLSSRFISTNLKFKIYRKDFYGMRKSFSFFYKYNKPNINDFGFINFYQKKNKFYYKYYLETSKLYVNNNNYLNLLKLHSVFLENNLLTINKPMVSKVSSKFSKYKNSIFLNNFDYKYIYNHLMVNKQKIQEKFKFFLKNINSSFYISKSLKNVLLLKDINNSKVRYNYNKIDAFSSFKRLNIFTDFIIKNDLLSNLKIWFFLKKYKIILKKFFKNNNFILYFKNKIKFNKNFISYFLNFSNFSEFSFLENYNIKGLNVSLIHYYYMNSQKNILMNFFKFFQSNYKLANGLLNNLFLLNIVHYNEILKYKKYKSHLYTNFILKNSNMVSVGFSEVNNNKELLYNFYIKNYNLNKDISIISINLNPYIYFFNTSFNLLNKNILLVINKLITKNFLHLDLGNNIILKFYFFLFSSYLSIYKNRFNNFFLDLSVYDF